MAHLEPAWHKEAIAPEVERVLEQLASLDAVTPFYLAGGTALALHFGHRRSVDLDFFSAESFHEDQLLASLQSATRLAVVAKDHRTLHVHVDEVKVSFLGYPYPMLFPVMRLAGVTIADPRDVALKVLPDLFAADPERVACGTGHRRRRVRACAKLARCRARREAERVVLGEPLRRRAPSQLTRLRARRALRAASSA